MIILGIETSCDETAVAIVEDGHKILSNVVVSQIDIFAAYGGVIPEIAARSHLEAIMPAIHQAFLDANLIIKKTQVKNLDNKDLHFTSSDYQDDWSKIDTIAVTHTPGLLGSLLVGTLTARTLAILHSKPLYAVHHLKSHIYANWLNSSTHPTFPLISLIISGGHTQIIKMQNHHQFEIIGTTRDDAVGECFDKVAKILGLPYPGGPSITKLAKTGDSSRYSFPHPMEGSLDFSFSGLKTAVLREAQKAINRPISFPSSKIAEFLTESQKADFAASFEQTVTDILIKKIKLALKHNPDIRTIAIAGGVSANQRLRHCLNIEIEKLNYKLNNKFTLFFPEPRFSGDNGAMVASAGFYEIKSLIPPTDPYKLNIMPRSTIQ